MADTGAKMKVALMIVIGAFILSAVFVGLRSAALKSAYDATNEVNVTDSTGTVHKVSASPISGDIIALVYAIAAGLVWLVAIVAILFLFLKGM